MLRIQQIKLTLSESLDQLPDKIINKLHISSEDLLSWRIYRESLDARRAKDVHFTYCIDCRVKHEEQVLRKHFKDVSRVQEYHYAYPKKGVIGLTHRPVVVGFGPAGMFAALLLAQAGWACTGVTLRLYAGADAAPDGARTCCSLEDVEDARAVARRLGIRHYTFNFTEAFERDVIGRFVQGYLAGETPNPCIDCNKHIKFSALLRRAQLMGCTHVATGHYARIVRGANGRMLLQTGLDAGKDQSYMLYGMTQRELAHTLFPLGALTKAEVRALALENGFGNARKRDSQDICFVPDGDYAAFVERHTGCPCPPGDILDEAGRVVGRHRGYIRYTVGQRRGLGIAAPQPLYVRGVCPARNTVTVAGAGALYTDTVDARELNWIACDALGERPVRLLAKLRYRQPARRATAWQTGPDTLRVRFDEPQRAPAPGQALVLYDGGTVVGGGVLFSTV